MACTLFFLSLFFQSFRFERQFSFYFCEHIQKRETLKNTTEKKLWKKNSNPVWIKWKLQTHLYLYNLSFICFSWPFFTLKKNHTPTEFLRVKLERKRNEQHFDIPQHDTSYYAVRSCKGAFYGQFFLLLFCFNIYTIFFYSINVSSTHLNYMHIYARRMLCMST
jgi:hypothetical protein